MTTLRIFLLSMVAALLLYVPFYHFAPIYQDMYAHVPTMEVTVWKRFSLRLDQVHGGIQLYIAYILMYVALGLTLVFEGIYIRFLSVRLRRIAWGIGAIGTVIYLWIIGFSPPMEQIGFDGQGILFIAFAVTIAFIWGRFSDRWFVKALLLLLLFGICMATPVWSKMNIDLAYLAAPALRTLHGYALNQSYFQYDYFLSFLVMLWVKAGLAVDRFHVVGELSFLAFFIGIYFLAKKILFDKRLAVYFIISLVIIKIYGNISDTTLCPQVTPMRLDLWLILMALVLWKGPQHWILGIAFSFLLVFHHAFGMIYTIAYGFLILNILVLNILKDPAKMINAIKGTVMQFLPNAGMIVLALLIYQALISSKDALPAFNYLKYNVGFMPIKKSSLFWYVPVLVNTLFLLLWKNRAHLPQRYFQAGIFLVFLVIGNLLYFFGRSHENNLVNIAGSLWLLSFMLMDLIIHRLPRRAEGAPPRGFIPLAGVFIVGLVAFFYCGKAVDRITLQAANLPKIADLFNVKSTTKDIDLKQVREVTNGNPKIVFLSERNDFDYYYYGGYTPSKICPVDGQFFVREIYNSLENELSQGSDIIVPTSELPTFIEIIIILNAKYVIKYDTFIFVSNNPPGI